MGRCVVSFPRRHWTGMYEAIWPIKLLVTARGVVRFHSIPVCICFWLPRERVYLFLVMFLNDTMTGDHGKLGLRYTQKTVYFAVFSNNVWSCLLWSPATIMSEGGESSWKFSSRTLVFFCAFSRCGVYMGVSHRILPEEQSLEQGTGRAWGGCNLTLYPVPGVGTSK